MPARIACSACLRIIPEGSTVCPHCALPLTAQAIPVVESHSPLVPAWLVVVLALIAVVLGLNLASAHDTQKSVRAQDAFAVDASNGALNSVQAVEARCGAPRWTRTTPSGSELHYVVNGLDYYVLLSSSAPTFQAEHLDLSGGKARTYRVNLDAAEAFADIECR